MKHRIKEVLKDFNDANLIDFLKLNHNYLKI
jgi:hypothetical protein